MSVAAAPHFICPTSYSLRNHHSNPNLFKRRKPITTCNESPSEKSATNKKQKQEDTRIHWSNQEDGWIGTKKSPFQTHGAEKKAPFEGRFADLIKQAATSHYQFLGVEAEAEIEEIKAAYRRLSKEYHPDTTSLPLKTASQKFIQLREAYNVLSREESRKFYDWSIAKEAESKRATLKLEDPYQQDVQNAEPIPDMVDRLGGKNMRLSDQAMSALTFDVAIIIFCICCIVYVVFFKEPY
uniref:Chaperone DnaJ-domain superfamily protein n=1 Tax=Masdevallia picturata TaxID=125444 RepID=A0A0F7H112_9ASPA